MATYFVDHAGSATNPYDTQAKAATTLAGLLAAVTVAAGDTIYCCDSSGDGTLGETITSEIDLNASGTNAGGWIKLIGCNASGQRDGTRYVISCGGNGINGIDLAGQDMWWFENIRVTNTGGSGKSGFYCSTGNSDGLVFVNCCADNTTRSGFYAGLFRYYKMIRCTGFNNTNYGIEAGNYGFHLFCSSHDNSTDGFISSGLISQYVGCMSYDNTDDEFGSTQPSDNLFNCMVDGSGSGDDGIELSNIGALYATGIFGCRITNHSGATDCGIYLNNEPAVVGWCYFKDNTDNINDDTSVFFQPVPNANGTSTNIEDDTDADDGYADRTNHDFNLNSDALLRRTAITIPIA